MEIAVYRSSLTRRNSMAQNRRNVMPPRVRHIDQTLIPSQTCTMLIFMSEDLMLPFTTEISIPMVRWFPTVICIHRPRCTPIWTLLPCMMRIISEDRSPFDSMRPARKTIHGYFSIHEQYTHSTNQVDSCVWISARGCEFASGAIPAVRLHRGETIDAKQLHVFTVLRYAGSPEGIGFKRNLY